jgi:Predicted AAA-ATPase/PD-(D/E)XK nuclease superfamily
MKLPIGVSDFQELIEKKYLFVDKTLLLHDIIEDGSKVILITRPRRFGKTLNLSMLYYFLQSNTQVASNIFENLLIAKEQAFCQAHQNQYPVIFLTFKDIKQATFESSYENITLLISKLYREHRYLLNDDCLYEDEKSNFMKIIKKEASRAELENSLITLAEYLQRKFQKNAMILIDEYDTPIQEAYMKGYYPEMIALMRGILGPALKDNDYLDKAVITGITRVSQESMFSGLNNIAVYSLLKEKFGQYFGFTEEEVVVLVQNSSQDLSLEGIKEWYNGYQIGKHVLYNPWSILNCLDNKGLLEPYWVNTSTNDLINKLLGQANISVKRRFESLLQGKTIKQSLAPNLIFPDIEKQPAALWSLLLHAGYLKVLSSRVGEGELIAEIAIPNQEIRFLYVQIVKNWFSGDAGLEAYDKFIRSLMDSDIAKFKHYIASYLIQTGSYFNFNTSTSEQIFHVFVLGLVVGLREHYTIHSDQEAGLGRFDVIFMPKDKKHQGILLEFKVARDEAELLDKAKEALHQIKDKEYLQAFKQHQVTKVLAIGMAFYGKQLELVSEDIEI